MAFAVRHPIVAKIDDRARYLLDLLEEYPEFLENWEKTTESQFAEEARKIADGDKEIERSYFNSLISSLDDDEERKNYFYQAILIMGFSYYESCVTLLARDINTQDKIEAICNSKNIKLSNEAYAAVKHIQTDINNLRNNICHNSFGTFRKPSELKNTAREYKGIVFDGDTLGIYSSDIVTDAIRKMHMVLRELCEKLHYKSKKIG